MVRPIMINSISKNRHSCLDYLSLFLSFPVESDIFVTNGQASNIVFSNLPPVRKSHWHSGTSGYRLFR